MRPLVVDGVAKALQYLDHLLPVYEALPDEIRGRLYVGDGLITDSRLKNLRPGPLGDVALVSAWGDMRRVNVADRERPIIFMEHGAGMIHGGNMGAFDSYAGSINRKNVGLFLCPNEFVAAANRRTHPYTPSIVVGCPKLDPWHNAPPKNRGKRPVVAFAFHWDCTLTGGTRSALPHYRNSLQTLLDNGWDVVAHGHPRMEVASRLTAVELGVPYLSHITEVYERADLLISDISSVLYEFASLDRPVVVCNAPWYDKREHTGLRFWEAIPGVQVDEPDDLVAAVKWALEDDKSLRRARHEAIDQVYPVRGNATATAVEAIKEFTCRS